MWVITDFVPGSYGTPSGHVRLLDPEGNAETMELPDGLFPIIERVSMAPVVLGDKSRMFLNGGLSDNCQITEQRYLLRNFIAPVSLELTESAAPLSHQVGIEYVAAADGLTGSCIFYLRFYDSLHDRRSPFSGPSPAHAMTGLLVPKFRNVPNGPNPTDLGVDQVEVWVWRNGITDSAGRPDIRRIATRDVGASTITITETVEGLAETEQALQQAPRCRFNAIYHNRLAMAGDERHPERLYLSPINRFDDYTGVYVNTLGGEAITGLVRVRDSLIILCAFSSYTLVGYSTSDLAMEELEPDLGCLTHFGVAKVGQLAIIPTHQGLAVCNGTSMKLLPGDYQKLWTARATSAYAGLVSGMSLGFAVNDRVSNVYKFFEESVSNPSGVPSYNAGRYWIFDYGKDGLSSEINIVPRLSFDTHSERPKCAAMMAAPGAKASSLYTAFQSGFVVLENQWGSGDYYGDIAVIIEPAMIIGEFGGGPYDGLTLEQMWFFIYNMGLSPSTANVQIQNGNEFCVFISNPIEGIHTEEYLLNMQGSDGGKLGMTLNFGTIGGFGDKWFPQTLMLQNQNLTGEGFAPRITVVNPLKLIYRGHGMAVSPGKKFAHPVFIPE